MFLRKAAAGVIKPEILPPTEGAAALFAYLPANLGLDAVWNHGLGSQQLWKDSRESRLWPVYNQLPMGPEELLEFTSCNCRGDCSNRHCCRKNEVKCISACGNCKGITCKNCIDDKEEPEEDSDLDSWSVFDCFYITAFLINCHRRRPIENFKWL